jgi:hypothetical protein
MAWRSAYSVALSGASVLGQSYNYVARIPAASITDDDVFYRLVLRGPSSGSSHVQALWIGHPAASGDAYDFDGGQIAVTVGGLGSFTVGTNASVTTDPISFIRDPAKDVLVAYELLNNDRYASNLSLASTFSLNWKAGAGDSDTSNKTGYTTATGRTALVTGIEVTDSLGGPPPDPDPEEEDCCVIKESLVRAGEVHSSGTDGVSVAGSPGNHLHFHLMNPSTTGKVAMLYQAIVTADADTLATIRSHNSALANSLPKCNLMFGAGQGLCGMTWGYSASILGNFHSVIKLRAGVPTKIIVMAAFNPDKGILLALHSAGVGASCNFEWHEST